MNYYEKVNPEHPDKIADRISGALVDICYKKQENPKAAIEVLIGHGICNVISESSYIFNEKEVKEVIDRIAGKDFKLNLKVVKQDKHLADIQKVKSVAADNGIFKGRPISNNERRLLTISSIIYDKYKSDGKYILTDKDLIICLSNADSKYLLNLLKNTKVAEGLNITVNPIGDWTGGTEVDTGATNRKLGSDMGEAVTGGGLHGKDFTKADFSVNVFLHILATLLDREISAYCKIGDSKITVKYNNNLFKTITKEYEYSYIIDTAKNYLKKYFEGSFEKFAEWGIIGY